MPDVASNSGSDNPQRRRLLRHPCAPPAVLAMALCAWGVAYGSSARMEREQAMVTDAPDLRALFRSRIGPDDTRVGRLAIELVRGNTVSRIGLEHRFRTGDTFRFAVSCNQSGWLYVLHRSPSGEPQLLWPRLEATHPERYRDDNRVWAGETARVPPEPDLFLFDDEIGNEYFYVVIQPDRRAPRLSVLALPDPPEPVPAPPPRPVQAPVSGGAPPPAALAAAAPQRPKIVQFSVRGAGTAQTPMRGVVLVPGADDPDPNAYFAPDPYGDPGKLVFEFRLRHED